MAEVLLLSLAAGLLGTWIVLRGLAFFSHAVGTAAFPGLVLAEGLGVAAPLGAFAAAVAFALGVRALAGRRGTGYDSLTAVALAGFLAAGVMLASDVFHTGSAVESLLFGSLLVIGAGDLALAAAASALVVAATALLGARWLARGFDPAGARAVGLRSALPDLALLALIALTTIAALAAIGALLAAALLVVPAATVRLWTDRMLPWQLGSIALAAGEGVAGILASVELNAPPGATIAVIAASVFGMALLARRLPVPRRARWAVAPAAAVAALAALAGWGVSPGGGPGLDAVATTTQLADMARAVGGDRVDLHGILQPNTDPHDYEPRPHDVLATARADVALTSGDGLDAWMSEVVSQSGGHPRVVDVGASVPVRIPGEDTGADAPAVNPHWWHDPRNAEAAVATIRDAFSRADPAGAPVYAARAAAYIGRVRALDRGIRACIAEVPAARRVMVTDHDAFSYFARRYGIRVVGAVIPSQLTQAQPSAGEVADLVRIIRETGVRAVFPEESVSARLAEAIARDTGASAAYRLYGDTLGPEGSRGATYLGMEAANADAVVRGLTGGATGCRIAGIS